MSRQPSRSTSRSVAANTLSKINNMDDKICSDFFKQLLEIKKNLSSGKNINEIKIKNPLSGSNINYNGPVYQSIKNKCYDISKNHPDLKKILDDVDNEFKLRSSPSSSPRAASNAIKYKSFDEKLKEINELHIDTWKNNPTNDPFINDNDYKKDKSVMKIDSYLSENCKYYKLYVASMLFYLEQLRYSNKLDEENIENIKKYLPTHHIIYGTNNTEFDYLFMSMIKILEKSNINNIYDDYIAVLYTLIFNKYSILNYLYDIIDNTNIGKKDIVLIQSVHIINNNKIIKNLYDVILNDILIYIKNILNISDINQNIDKTQVVYYKTVVKYYNSLLLNNTNLINNLNTYLRNNIINDNHIIINSNIGNNFNILDFMTKSLDDIEVMFELSNKLDERQSPLSPKNNILDEPNPPRKPQLPPNILKYENRLKTLGVNPSRIDYLNKYLDNDYEIYLETNDITKQDFINKYETDLNSFDDKIKIYNEQLQEYNKKYDEYKIRLEEYNKENEKYINKRASPLGSLLPPNYNKSRNSLLRSLFAKDSPDIKPKGKFDKNKAKCVNKTDLLTQDELEELPLNKLQLLVKIRVRKYHDIDDANKPNFINWNIKDWTNNNKNELKSTLCYDVVAIYNHIVKCVNENKEPYDPYDINRKLSKENLRDILKKIKFITKNVDMKLPVKNIPIDKNLTIALIPFNYNPYGYNNPRGMWYNKLVLQVELGGIFFNIFTICLLPIDERLGTITDNIGANLSTDLTSIGLYENIDIKLFKTQKLLHKYVYPFKIVSNGEIKIIKPPILFNRYRTDNNWEINNNGNMNTLDQMKNLLKDLHIDVNNNS